MRIKLLCIAAMLCLVSVAMAQTTVKGAFIDSVSNQGESYATVHFVLKNAPTQTVKLAVTNTNGSFNEKINGTGDFILTITAIGKKTATKEFTIKDSDKIIDLGNIYTLDDTEVLKGASVTAQVPLVKVDVDKIEYNMQGDPEARTSNTLDMLRKVPLVTVDGEDKVQINGSSSFKVYVNGKPNNMISNNVSDVLKSMPANTIKKIEVITDPGAKYDAEGTSGILNIVTIGGGFEGYTATFSGGVSNSGANGGLYASIKQGKLTLSLNYNYHYMDNPQSSSYNYRENFLSDTAKYYTSDMRNKYRGSFQFGNMEASYEFDTLRLLTMSVGLWGGNNDSWNNGYTEMLDKNNVLAYNYSQHGKMKGSRYSIEGGINYQRSFKNVKDRLLTFSYKISAQPNENDNYYTYSDMNNVPTWLSLLNRHVDGSQSTTEHTFQIDYTTPIGKHHNIEAGAKYIIRDNTSNNKSYLASTIGADDYAYDVNQSSHYKHLNDILASYVGHTFKYKDFSIKTGLRYEHTSQDVEYIVGNGTDFNVKFNDIVPSATIGMKLSKTQNVRLGYNMRISRPSIYYLNPYIDNSNPANISYGNSELESEKRHNINLTYSMFSPKFSLNLSLSHAFGNNGIEQYSFMVGDVMNTTYDNIGHRKSTGLSAYINWTLPTKTQFYCNAFANYVDMESKPQNLRNHGWTANCYAGIMQTLPLNFRFNLGFGGSTPSVSLQGRSAGYNYYGASLNRSFLKENRLTLRIYASDIFTTYSKFESKTETETFLSKSTTNYPRRRYGVGVSYRIGNLKASVKKVARSINNDDVKSGGDSSGGGGNSQGTGS